MPDAEFHTLPDHGHVPWLEPDEGVSERVRAFLG
jgi:pimeloyl-ACP methyl ester carboxylesterase